MVYTIAGVTLVVTGAGVVYYLSDSNKTAKPAEPSPGKKKSKKSRQKAKAEAEEVPKQAAEPSQPGS